MWCPRNRVKLRREAERLLRQFLDRLRTFTVLDPACGSGNFLYLALHALKDLEHRVQLEAEALGSFQRQFPGVGPANVKGIEINPYAAELARVSNVRRLPANMNVAFMGDTKGGPFDVTGDQAREWLRLPTNPNGRTNADVLKPWVNGMNLTRRPAGKWIVDFGWTMSASDAALYEEPFRWVQEHVHPMRQRSRRKAYRQTGGGTWNRGRACGARLKDCRATSPRRPLPSTVSLPGWTLASARIMR